MENTEQNTSQRLDAIESKLDAVYTSVEKTRKYFQIILWVTVAMVVLPAIGLVFVVPAFLNSYLGGLDGLL
jgi:preprotein translocase subunit SecE